MDHSLSHLLILIWNLIKCMNKNEYLLLILDPSPQADADK